MTNLQFHSNYSNMTQDTSSSTSLSATDLSTQNDTVNINYDTTPTPSFKMIPNSTSRQDMYYTKQEEANNNTDPIDDEIQQRHMQQLIDKKRRRRESHNAVERRRRDNINERIFELSTLLPERDATKNNKGTILRKSVDHIRLLHEKVNEYQQRIQELENILNMYRMRWGDLNQNTSSIDLSGLQPQQFK